jgi:hypothetical protein
MNVDSAIDDLMSQVLELQIEMERSLPQLPQYARTRALVELEALSRAIAATETKDLDAHLLRNIA